MSLRSVLQLIADVMPFGMVKGQSDCCHQRQVVYLTQEQIHNWHEINGMSVVVVIWVIAFVHEQLYDSAQAFGCIVHCMERVLGGNYWTSYFMPSELAAGTQRISHDKLGPDAEFQPCHHAWHFHQQCRSCRSG